MTKKMKNNRVLQYSNTPFRKRYCINSLQLLSLTLLLSVTAAKTGAELAAKSEAGRHDEIIIVTAFREASHAGSNIGNIDKLSAEEIEQLSHIHIQELLVRSPGVNLQRGNGQEYLPAIRSPVLTGPGACGAFLMMEDNIPLRAAGFCNMNELFEAHTQQAEAIEVIRGPGTAFYGSNALHGVINVLTPEVPDSEIMELGFEAGSYDFRRLKASMGDSADGPDGQSSDGYHLALTTEEDGGYRDDSGYQQQKFSGRYRHSINSTAGSTMIIDSGLTITNLEQETAGFIVGLDSYQDEQMARTNLNPEAYRDAQSLRVWSRFEKHTSDTTNWQITPYIRLSEMTFMQHFLPGKPVEENGQQSIGFQLAYYSDVNDSIKFSMGLDGELSDGYLKQTQQQATEGSPFLQETIPAGKQYDYQVDASVIAPFVHLDWQLSDKWQLSAGIRYEQIDYDYDNQMLDGRTREDGTSCGFGGCRYSRPADSENSFNNWTPKLGLGYQLGESALLFMNLSRGFRAPQTTELYRLQRQQTTADLDSVQLDSYEAGFRFQSGLLNYELAYYQMYKDNVIYRDSSYFNLSNGKSDHQGLEIRVDYAISNTLSLSFNSSFGKHRYAHDQLLGGVNINGNDVDTAPRHFGAAQLDWVITDDLLFELEWLHQGSYFTDAENLHRYQGHNLMNIRADWQLNHQWSLNVHINNLTDQFYADRADYTSFTEERYFPGMPMSLFLGLKWSGGL